MTELNDRQLLLLMDLHVLEEAGMINEGCALDLKVNGRTDTVEIDGVITEAGKGAAMAYKARPKTMQL